MKRSIVPLGVAVACLLASSLGYGAGPPLELVDGDRVVLIGSTLIERDQSFGYLETRLTRSFPDRSITFRNLGWSGDNVEGESRAGFGSVADGFKHLVDHVLALKPTVIVVGYGAAESFDGRAGLPRFVEGMEKLLKAIEPTRARLVFLAPNRQENLGPPLPDPALHNADLALYRDAIRAIADQHRATFIDLFDRLPMALEGKVDPRSALTTNGLHFNDRGAWQFAAAIEDALSVPRAADAFPIDPDDVKSFAVWHSQLTKVGDVEETPTGGKFKRLDPTLPAPPLPEGGPTPPGSNRVVKFAGLKPGRYTLKADDRAVATADRSDWSKGVLIEKGPEIDQVEALRKAINAKNELYFYRWRPQNETYLFGFRKHEQGQNAREIPLFDPLVEAREKEIARLRVPVSHRYELIREGEVGR